jgi:outer membrane murein-binding lipoprotein Lpp
VLFTAVLSLALALLAAGFTRSQRRERRQQGEVNGLAERVRELAARVEATEADVAHAVTQAEITETLLLEKGLADEDDLEAARRRFDGDDPGPSSSRYLPGRDGGLH